MPMRRTLKNVVKNYTDAQVKVREATSNDPWGPSSTLMTEIADLTYNVVAYTEIMQMIWKRLNDHGKNWRHVYKSLVVLDYIIKTGSEKVAQQCKENIYAIQTLKDFQYQEDNKDQGMNVREKAKQLMSLLKDDERLRNERAKSLKAKERFAQSSQGVGSQPSRSASAESPTFRSDSSDSPVHRRRHSNTELDTARPASIGEEELQLQLALAMSREEHDEQVRRQKSDDIKLQMAIDESRRQQAENRTLASMAGQARQTSDPWGSPAAPQSKASDPWGASLPAPPGSHHKAPAGVQNDPWGSPAHQAPPPSPPTNGTPNNTGHNIDEAFDVLGTRTSPAKTDLISGQSLDIFDPLAANNPFSSPQPVTNPFEQTGPQRVTMNELQANTYMSGFSQPATSGLLPAPMVPLSNQVQQHQQQQSYNPFL
ncbi:EPN2-like protein [Mya arenaria]|uniref:EPN2-like protein n=1 Tax=Mya arenaria TaxID=6604 RepID=A0ABY7DCA1_MYAAR|nr:EPN2-like protein [Mya arenaria]